MNGYYYRERNRTNKALRKELTQEQLNALAEIRSKKLKTGVGVGLAALAAIAGAGALGYSSVDGARFASDVFGDFKASMARGDRAALGAALGLVGVAGAGGIWAALYAKAAEKAALRKYKKGDLGRYLDAKAKTWSALSPTDQAELSELTRAMVPMYYDDDSTVSSKN